ncbi:MAG TPA: translation elongation factor Ts [Patescibacteria group bacterium]|nr:translation elongation factor Ts [Patescibacteria group bacterium]
MSVDIESIKKLKDLTGVGLTDAKKALEESKGDFDKALAAMRQKGLTKAEKRGLKETRAGVIGTYNHDNRIGVLIEVNCETDFVARNDIFKELVKDIAMHIAASNPIYVSYEDIPKIEIKKAEEEFRKSEEIKSKPKEIQDKIIKGQVDKYFQERCLKNQPFVKDLNKNVEQYIKETSAKLGENIVVRRFTRYGIGEL